MRKENQFSSIRVGLHRRSVEGEVVIFDFEKVDQRRKQVYQFKEVK